MLPAQDRWQLPATIWRTFEHLKLNPTRIVQGAGLDDALISDRGFQIGTSEAFSLWRALEKETSDPFFFLPFIHAANAVGRDATFYAAYHAPSYRQALRNMARFKQLYSPVRLIVLEAQGRFHCTREWPTTDDPEPHMSVDYSFAEMIGLGRLGTGRRIRPMRVELTRKGPRNRPLEEYLDCSIRYGASKDLIVISSVDLDLPFESYNPDVLDYIEIGLTEEMERRARSGTIGDAVRIAVRKQLREGTPHIDTIASNLGLGVRSLQRKLRHEGTDFSEIVALTRILLAERLMRKRDLSISEIAHRSGFSDQTSFYRSFRKIHNTTPSKWRGKHNG